MSLKKLSNNTIIESIEYEIRKACFNGNIELAIKYLDAFDVLNINELNQTKVLLYAVKSDVILVKRF